MDETAEVQHKVRRVSALIWTTPNGLQTEVPERFAHVKMRKDGWPDKRDALYNEFMEWANGLSDESIAAHESANTIPTHVDTIASVETVDPVEPITQVEPVAVVDDRAQLYAMRIWEGQSPDMPRPERVMRVTRGVEAQGMSMLGVVLPK